MTCCPPAPRGARLRERLAPLRCVLVVAAVLIGVPLLLATPADASSDPEDRIVRYDQTIELRPDGRAGVTLELDVDFGSDPNRGPVLWYLVKQPVEAEEPTDRVYRMTDFFVTSSTGAETAVETSEEGAYLEVRIGDEDRDDFTGVHSYRITYQVEGWVSSTEHFPRLDEDELYLNVIGSAWQVPLEDVRVTVIGPADVADAECVATDGDEPCTDADHTGTTAELTQDELDAGEPMTVRVTYPAGTFAGAPPLLQDRWTAGRAFAAEPGPLALTAVLGLGGTAAVVHRVRRRGRDEQFRGLTPGLAPAAGQQADVGPRTKAPVAVRFTPPDGLRPGQVGTLVDEVADPHDVTATLVDLAVRGYLRIEQVEAPDDDGSGGDWRLVLLGGTDEAGLLAFERLLLTELFEGRDTITLSELRTTFAASMAQVQDALYDDVTTQGWFRDNPKHVRTAWGLAAAGLITVGVVATVLLAIWTTWALVGVAVVAVGVVAAAVTGTAPARTAAGTAVLAQAQGFRQYLETAEADQIRFEEGEDLFSRYLPFAIAFGLAERWAGVFAELAARGQAMPEPTWYVGAAYLHGGFWHDAGAFTRDLTGFTAMADSAISTPTPGSSGSGGSTFSGGGVSGGGGGTW